MKDDGNEESDDDEDWLNPAGLGLNNHAGEDADDGEDCDHEQNEVVHGILDGAEERGLHGGGLPVGRVPESKKEFKVIHCNLDGMTATSYAILKGKARMIASC